MVDIDRFFTLGPDVPFQANNVFTDRERHIAVYRERIAAHQASRWSTDELLNFRRAARNVMVFCGDGGIGKSTMVRHLANLSVDGGFPEVNKACAAAVVDFADAANQSYETVLLRVRTALGVLGRSWPAFDIALALYWERKHPGESLAGVLRRSTSFGKASETVRASEQITTVVDQLLGGFGAVGLAARLAEASTSAARKARTVRRLRRDLPAFDAVISENDPDRMLGYLPVLLAYDLERIRAKRAVTAICVLDTFEIVQSLPAERNGLEDLVSRLAYLMPNVFFLVASRRPLQWHDPVRGVGLTYGGERRWPGLAQESDDGDQFPVDAFDESAADAYLCARLTRDDQPAIPTPVRRRIIEGCGGSPLYLELAAERFEQLAAAGHDPAPDEFGRPFPELVLRVMRDLSAEDRDLLRTAALLEAFDEEVLRLVMPGVRGRQREEFLRRSFIRHDPGVWPPYRLHENLRRSVIECDDHTSDGWTAAERRGNLLRATRYLEDVVLAVWQTDRNGEQGSGEPDARTVAAFLLVLHAAAEHGLLPPRLGHLAFTLRELGHWQVLASLPDYADSGTPALAGLTAAAKAAGRADADAGARYEQVQEASRTFSDGTYHTYIECELGYLAFFAGRLEEADRHFSRAAADESVVGSGALFGLAGNALRQSRFSAVTRYMDKTSDARLDRARVADMLGHLQLHNGDFARAAALFTETLEHARQAGAPLWIGRALRHLALARMWFAPDQALALIPEGRELNRSLGDGVGIAQCDMAAALSHALRGEWADAERFLAEARAGLEAVGVTFEMLPVEPIQVLVHLGQGQEAEAASVAHGLISAANAGRPCGPPAWSAITALWLNRGDWYDFGQVDWLDPEAARRRWLTPLARLGVVRPEEG